MTKLQKDKTRLSGADLKKLVESRSFFTIDAAADAVAKAKRKDTQ
jgi:hypothetical protein